MKDTREKIMEAAFVLMAKKGVGGVSTSDIASALGISRSLPYRYFPNKRELVFECFKLYFCDRFFPSNVGDGATLGEAVTICCHTLRDIISNVGSIIGEKIDVFSYNALYIDALKREPRFKKYTVTLTKRFKKCVLSAVKRGEIRDVGSEFVMRSIMDIFGRASDIVTEKSNSKNLENIVCDMHKFYELLKK